MSDQALNPSVPRIRTWYCQLAALGGSDLSQGFGGC